MDKVNELENQALTKSFEEEEIKGALFQMEKNKAAGPDGFPIELFQTCWEIIKKDIIEMFNDSHAGILDIKGLKYDIITLLPNSAIQTHLFTKLFI